MAQLSPQVQLRLSWGKCNEDKWCPLNTVDLDSPVLKQSGVYVIWHGGTKPRTVYVGQGKFDDRLRSHQQDARIQAYKAHGLYVTWAPVEVAKRNGVEVFLATHLKPLVGDRHPDAPPIVVNLPWG